MKAPYVNFRDLKSQVSIRQVLDYYHLSTDLKGTGDALSGNCPICHSESSRCFRVSQEKNCFKCFSCDAGGNMLDFVAAMEACTIREAAVKVADWFDIQHESPSRRNQATSARTQRKPAARGKRKEPPAPQTAAEVEQEPTPVNAPLTFELKLDPEHPWLSEVGLRSETIEEFGLGFCSKGLLGGRIAFPIRNEEGELIGYAGRLPTENPSEGQCLWKYPKELDLDRVAYRPLGFDFSRMAEALVAMDPLQVAFAWQLGLTQVVHFPGRYPCPDGMRSISISLIQNYPDR